MVHSSAIAMSVLPALCTRAAAGDIRDVASTPPSPQHAEAEHQWGPAQPPQMLKRRGLVLEMARSNRRLRDVL